MNYYTMNKFDLTNREPNNLRWNGSIYMMTQ